MYMYIHIALCLHMRLPHRADSLLTAALAQPSLLSAKCDFAPSASALNADSAILTALASPPSLLSAKCGVAP